MAEPRKLTIKIRKPGEPIAAKPVAPAPAAAPAPAPAAEPELTPIPEAPVAAAPAASVPNAESAQQAKRQTSRIELPPEITQPSIAVSQPSVSVGSEDATIKLKPVSQNATPESPEAAQATKSKTARIALDSVLGGIQSDTPLSNTTQKTIKLKRAVPAGGTKTVTSSPIKPIAPAAGGEEKTVKLKRPGLTIPKKETKPVEPELEQLESLDDDMLAPLPELNAAPAEESTGAKAFTIIGVIAAAFAIIATVALCIILQKQAASPNGDLPTGNTLHSLPFQRF